MDELVPAVPGQFTPTSYRPPEGMTFEQYEEVGAALQQAEFNISRALTQLRWWIADWLNYGEHQFGDKYAQAAQILHHRYSEGTLRDMQWTGLKVSCRHDVLSFEHHRQVAPLPSEEQEAVLSQAEEEDWSVADTRQEVRQRRGGTENISKDDQWDVLEAWSRRKVGRIWTEGDHLELMQRVGRLL